MTAARASEIAGARKAEFQNLDKPEQAAWLVPGERAKNKLDHLIPLAPLAVEAIKSAIELSGESDFLFPTRLGRGGPIDRHTLTVAMVGSLKPERAGSEGHGSRRRRRRMIYDRTSSTRLARMGIAKEIRDRTLNHITSLRDPESKHYNLYDFEKEKRAALNHWAAEIAAIASPAKVPLDARKQAPQ